MDWNEAALIKNDPGTYRGTVVGVSFVPGYPQNLQALKKTVDVNGPLGAVIKRAPENQYDSNACEVWVDGQIFIGHLSRDLAAEIAPKLDSGSVAAMWITSIGYANNDQSKPGAGFYLKVV